MDRMLIVGKLNVHNKELNEFFGQYFESHLCSEEIVGFDKVLGVTGPMVVVISMIGNGRDGPGGFFGRLQEYVRGFRRLQLVMI